MSAYQPKTGQPCGCKRGIERDNCPACEGTGRRIDFAAIRARPLDTGLFTGTLAGARDLTAIEQAALDALFPEEG